MSKIKCRGQLFETHNLKRSMKFQSSFDHGIFIRTLWMHLLRKTRKLVSLYSLDGLLTKIMSNLKIHTIWYQTSAPQISRMVLKVIPIWFKKSMTYFKNHPSSDNLFYQQQNDSCGCSLPQVMAELLPIWIGLHRKYLIFYVRQIRIVGELKTGCLQE